jgi:hypothetical protein
MHTHDEVEQIYVLEGLFSDHERAVTACDSWEWRRDCLNFFRNRKRPENQPWAPSHDRSVFAAL